MALRKRRGPITLILIAVMALTLTFASERANASQSPWMRILTFWQLLLHEHSVSPAAYPYPYPYPSPHGTPPPCWFYPGPPPAGFRACPHGAHGGPPPCWAYPGPAPRGYRHCP